MGEFTNEDRAIQTRTLTLLEGHVTLSNERHGHVKKIMDDHEKRIRKNETIVAKVAVLCTFVGAGIMTFISVAVKKIGN